MFPVTKTDIAKSAVSTAVGMYTASLVQTQLEQRTDVNTERVSVQIGCQVVGQLVARQLRPITDKAVDATIVKIKSWKSNRDAK